MSTILEDAILEARSEMETVEDMLDGDGDIIDYVAGLTDHMVDNEPDYTEEDIDDDVKEMADKEELDI